MQLRIPMVILLCTLLAAALAHRPRFPEGPGPFEVIDPPVSQAFYLRLPPGERHLFVLPPLERAVPLQLLVLDDEAGRLLELVARVRCAGEEREPTGVDQPFFEEFTRMELRYRVVDSVGPSETGCEVEVWERFGLPGSYVFSVGSEESFGIGDMLGLLNLRRKLSAWRQP